jgi:serine/threonine protein kinase
VTDETLFAAALALPAADRPAFLAANCPDPAVRKQVEELLAAAAASNPLDQRLPDLDRTNPRPETVSEPTAAVGDRVGPYKLLEKIGEGGMGEVWVADQLEPIKRRVALKLIKPGMDSRSVLGRFEAERQALAVMDHPNIAMVLDAGTTTDGRPYFVMELVKGTPITEFADARKLTTQQRLELFVPVCQAIQHAHMKGIIHRDIKPSNVLVALHDETPVPKVIDFGVAKAVGQQLTEKTIYTGFGALVGTPAYMAPEQATFNQLDVDTRADVYALGVLLYELLAGSPPIERDRLKKAALDEVLRIVRDEEPPRPSARLSTSQAKASIAATRGSEPAKLSQLMKGELDWIVMKALEKDRTRRYESANGFAADVQRYLAGEQVQAVPPSVGYRVRKWWRKNRTAGLVACAFAGLICGAATVAFLLAAQAIRAERRAVEERNTAEMERANALAAQAEADAARLRAEAAAEAERAARERADHFRRRAQDALKATADDMRLLFANGRRGELTADERRLVRSVAGRMRGFARQVEADGDGPDRAAAAHLMAGLLACAVEAWDDGFRDLEAAAAHLARRDGSPDLAVGGVALNLGMTAGQAGGGLRDQGRPADSLRWFDLAARVLAPVVANKAASVFTPLCREVLRDSYQGRAEALDRLNRLAEAEKDWGRAVELTTHDRGRQAVRAAYAVSKLSAGQVAEAVAVVAQLRQFDCTADQLYHFARVYSVASVKMADKKGEHADAAMEMLAKAVKVGYKNYSHAKQDPDLDPLRDRDDFKKLLADLEAKYPPKQAAPESKK